MSAVMPARRTDAVRARDLAIGSAVVRVSIRDPRLAQRVAKGIEGAVAEARARCEAELPPPRVVRFRTQRRLDGLEGEALLDAFVVIEVTPNNLRKLASFVDRARAAGALGIQLTWDGKTPPRERAERYVFAVLERSRRAPDGSPCILTTERELSQGLRITASHRASKRKAQE